MRQFRIRLSDEEMEALESEAGSANIPLGLFVTYAINQQTGRRAKILRLVADAKTKHADTLAALANR